MLCLCAYSGNCLLTYFILWSNGRLNALTMSEGVFTVETWIMSVVLLSNM